MGEVASVIKSLSCTDCAKYVCNNASVHSQCCDEEDGCNCELKTNETQLASTDEEIEVSIGNDSLCEGFCCNCLIKAHNK